MKKAIAAAITTLVMSPLIYVWCQACPSSNSLKAEPPLAMCPQVTPKGWQMGANVTVYFIGAFSGAQRAAIQSAYQNWSSRLGSNVTVTLAPDAIAMPSNPKIPYSEWTFASDPDCPGEQACTHDNWCPAGYEQHTLTNVAPGFSDPGYQLFAHEVGHTYGIDDCTATDCLSAVTVMQPLWHYYSAMSPRCCDSKLMYQMSGSYGQSANHCSPILVQGTAVLSQTYASGASTTFQQYPQSGDTIVVGCLGSYDYGGPFTAMDNQGVLGTNMYNPVVSTSIPPPFPGPIADAYLLNATQVVSSQSQAFTITCSTNGAASYIDGFALEYADLASGQDIDNTGSNSNEYYGVSPLSCGSLSTTAVNDLIVSLYNYNIVPLPTDSPASPRHPRGIAPDSGGIAPTLGTVPACPGGQGGYCISQPDLPLQYFPQPGGVSVYPRDTPPGPYTESWTSPLSCPPEQPCWFPMSCVSAAVKVIGP